MGWPRWRPGQGDVSSTDHAADPIASNRSNLRSNAGAGCRELETPPIFVNIPQYRLFAFNGTADREADMLQMDVIVGKEYPNTRTPVFTEEIRYLVFRPYWDVPYSIATRSCCPKIRANPAYLDRQTSGNRAGRRR